MTVDRREVITIPKWLIIVLIPILFGGVGGYATSRYSAGKQERQIEVNTKRLDIVEQSKVNEAEFQLVVDALGRIESKLDTHIDNSK